MNQALRFCGMLALAVAFANIETVWAAVTSPGGTQINWVTPPPSSVTAGATFQVSWTTVGTVLQIKVQSDETDPLSVTANVAESTRGLVVKSSPATLTAPTKRADGSTIITSPVIVKYVVIALDGSAQVASSDIVSVTVNPVPPTGPDLRVKSGTLILNPTSVAAGGTVTVNWTVENVGSTAASASQTLVQLKDGQGNPVGAGPTVALSSVAAGATFGQSVNLSVSSGTAAGTYSVEVKVDSNNGAVQGAGEKVNDSTAVNLTVTAPAGNAAPVIGNLNAEVLNYVPGSGAAILDNSTFLATVTDPDSANFDGGQLIISIESGGINAEDVLGIRNEGGGTGQIGLTGSNVTFGGVTIGTFTGGANGAHLVVSFDANSSPASAQALVRNINYLNTNTGNPSTAARTVRFVLSDGDGGSSANNDVTVNVSPANTVPTISFLNGDTLNYSPSTEAAILDDNAFPATVADSDSGNFDTGTLTVAIISGGNTAEDLLGIRNDGTASGKIGVSGNSVTFGGITIGTFSGGANGAQLVVTFNANSTPSAAQALVRNITYEKSNTGTPETTARTVRLVLSDGDGGASANNDVTVNVSSVNAVPVISFLDGDSLNYTAGTGSVLLDGGGFPATVTDNDSSDLNGGTLTVSIATGGVPAEDLLGIRNEGTASGKIGLSESNVTFGGVTIGTVSGGSSGVALVVTFNASSSPAAAQALVRNITYQNSNTSSPSTAARTVRFVLSDGDGGTSSNNDITVNFTIPSGSDLLVDQGAVTVSPSPILAGGNITVSFVIRNGGSGTAQASTTRVKVVGAGENVIVDQTFSVDVINAGATLNQSHPLTIPATAAAGTYGIEIKLDDANSAGQATNERVNDGATGSVVVTTPPTGPDLVFSPTSVTVGPSPVLAGGNITVGFRAANVGLANAGASTTRIRVEDSIQNLIIEATFSLPALNAGTGIDQNLQLTIPAGTPAASFSVVVKLDDTNEAGQTSGERNNDVLSGSVTVTTPASGPDLAFSPTSVTVGPSSVVAGGTFTVSYRVANIGLASAAVSTTRVRVEGPNQTLIVESTFTVPGLDAGAGADQSHLLSIPSGTSTGNFTVLVKLDDADQAGQASSERGNDSISGSVTVSAPPSGPDLVVDQGAVSVTPGTVVVGGNIEVSFTIRNLGLGAAAPSMTRVQAVEPGGNIISEKMFAVGSIGSGASLSQNHQLTIPLNAPAGQYEVRVHLDSTETSGQTPNERSNDQSQSGFLVNSGLTISAISDQTIFKNGATPAIIFAVNDPLADASATIFDNTTTSLDRSLFPGNEIEFGDQIFLAGGDRRLAEFQFQTFLSSNASGNETAELIIHANDGGTDAHPGTVLFQSGKFLLPSGFQIITVPDLLVNVPNSVTWTVKLGGIEAGEDAGLLLFDPPSVGASLDDFWRLGVDGTWSTFLIDNGATPANFWARAISPTGLSIDRSSSKHELVPVGNIVVEGLGINRTVTVTPLLNQVGTTTITLTVNNGRGSSASESFLVTVTEPPTGSGTGLRGDYFTDTSLNDSAFVRLDPKIDFDWSQVGPEPALGGAFSVRWTGQIEAEFTETYTFYTISDDSVRLVVNNQLVIDDSAAQSQTESRGTLAMTAGQKVDIVLEYFEVSGTSAGISLAWSSLRVQREIVPSRRLFPPLVSNSGPVLSKLRNQRLLKNASAVQIDFLVSDFETPSEDMDVSATSTDSSLVAVTTGGSGRGRSLTLTPGTDQVGFATIEVTVSDGTLSTSQSFLVSMADPIKFFIADLNGAKEVPPVTTTSATGNGKFFLDGSELRYEVTFADLSSPFTAAHIHGPASLTENATVIFPLNPPTGTGLSGRMEGILELTAAQIADLEAGLLYVNIHSTLNPGGEIRGQIAFEPNAAPEISFIPRQSVPINSPAFDVSFTFRDLETLQDDLILRKETSNAALVPLSNIVIERLPGGNGKVRITPVAGESGISTITIEVEDADHGVARSQFEFEVVRPIRFFSANLLGSNEVPQNSSTAGGSGRFFLQDGELRYEINYTGLASSPLGVQIHGPAGTGATAPPIFFLPFPPESGPSGFLTGEVNYNNAFGTGSAAPQSFVVNLSGAAERPDPVTTGGSGSGNLILTGNQLSVTVNYSGLSGLATGAHIHGPAGPDQTANVLVDLAPLNGGAFGASGALTGTVTLTTDQIAALTQGSTYVNIHTAANPVGEIRGQVNLDPPLNGPEFPGDNDLVRQLLSGRQYINILSSQFPSGEIRGQLAFQQNASPQIDFITDQTVVVGTESVSIPIRIDDLETSPDVLTVEKESSNLDLVPLSGLSITGNGPNKLLTITPVAGVVGQTEILLRVRDADQAVVVERFFFRVIQPLKFFSANLRGAHEVPPVTTTALGAGRFFLEGLELRYEIEYSGLSGIPTAAHIHGPASSAQTAGVVVTIPLPPGLGASGRFEGKVSFADAAQVTDLNSGLHYVNIHTPANPNGEIRGQLVFENNAPPTLRGLPAEVVSVLGSQASLLNFQIDDTETPIDRLIIEKVSSNTAFVPLSNIEFGGQGRDRTVSVAGAAGQKGSSIITIRLIDGGLRQVERSFEFRVVDPIRFFTAALSGSQVVPSNQSTAAGFGLFKLEGNALSYEINYSGLASGPTGVAIHGPAIAGEVASVIFGLPLPPNAQPGGRIEGAIIYSTDQVDQLLAGRQYVNIGAVGFPGGQIRGQLQFESNLTPTISPISDQRVNVGTVQRVVSFRVNDLETPLPDLILEKQSTNPNLVPEANIVFVGREADRTVQITPIANQLGSTFITIKVKDAGEKFAQVTFEFSVINPIRFFSANLLGSNEIPTVNTPALGAGRFFLDGQQLRFEIEYSGLVGLPTAAHIHGPASATENASPIFELILPPGLGTAGSFGGVVNYADSLQISALFEGQQYVNIHTTAFPDGEIRGQLNLEQNAPPVIRNLPDEVVAIVGSPAPVINFEIEDLETSSSRLVLEKASSNPDLIPAGNIFFGGFDQARNVTLNPIAGQRGVSVITVRVRDEDNLISERTFELRVINPVRFFSANLNGSNVVPFVPTPAVGSGRFFLEGDLLRYSIDYANLASAPTRVAVHGPADFGSNGPEVLELPLPTNPGRSGHLEGAVAYSSQSQIDDLLAGRQYILIKTVSVPTGAIRGPLFFQVSAPPQISFIPNQVITVGSQPRVINFRVSDFETAAEKLDVQKQSNDLSLIPLENITFAGRTEDRTVTIVPAAGQTGTTRITIQVTDEAGFIEFRTFDVRVALPVKYFVAGLSGGDIQPPVTTGASGLGEIFLEGDQARIEVDFRGLSGPPSAITIRKPSETDSVGPVVHTLIGTASAGRSGQVFDFVTLTASQVTDLEAEQYFVTVQTPNNPNGEIRGKLFRELNAPPEIGSIPGQTVLAGSQPQEISFFVGDLETPADELTLSRSSSNPTLIPENGIQLGGFGGLRTVKILPAAGQVGAATVTIEVTDLGGRTSQTVFDVVVISNAIVTFADSNLEQAVRFFLVKTTGGITVADLNQLTTLFISDLGITSLAGLQTAFNLEDLQASGNLISDLGPLAGLKKLRNLDVSRNSLTAIGNLSNLKKLQNISVRDNFISDINGLANLPELERLDLSLNSVSDLSPLVNLPILRELLLDGNLVSDLSPLVNLAGLEFLDLSNNPVASLSVIGDLRSLIGLGLSGNSIADLSGIAALSRLEFLNLGSNGISDATALTGLGQLIDLDLSGNDLRTLPNFSPLSNLRRLNLRNNLLDLRPASPASTALASLAQSGTVVETQPQRNTAPFALADTFQSNEDIALSVPAPGVLANDTDPDLTPLSAIVETQPSVGVLTLNSNGSFTYTPPLNFNGPVTFTYRASDGLLQSQPVQVTIQILPVNDAPVLAPIANRTVNEQSLLTLTAIATDVDGPGQSLVFSVDPIVPAGLTINPATGVLTWTPTEAQGPSTVNITVRVTDTGLPPLSATQIFTVTVNEVNVSPVVNPISSQTIGEGSTLSFSVSASDSDIPANTLTFSLGSGAPAGASISSGGFFSWTPTDAQGPGFFNITVQVSDGSLTAVQSFSVTVIEGNRSPLISAISSQTVNEGSLLNVQVQASDSDLPAQSLSYSLGAGAPPGASIGGSSGVFSWTPTETQGPGTYSIAVIVRDSGPGNLTANQSFSVTVNEVNQPPLLAGLSDQGVPEGSELSLFVAAADADLPPNKLTFSLRGAPSGATIDPASGIFTWTPTEAQGPSTNSITVVVTDDGPGTLSASQSFTVRVFEINSPPVLAPIPNQAVASGQPFSRTVAATDPDLPANALSYSLPFGGPAGSSINPVTGVFSWTPDAFSGASTNSITVQVSDNGSPVLSATQAFTLVVTVSNKAPEIANIADQTVDEEKALNIAVTATDLDIPTQTVTYGLAPGAPVGAAINPVTGAFSWTPTEAQGPSSNTITVQARDSGVPPLTGTKSFTVVVREVNQPPTMGPIGDRTVLAGSPLSAPVSAADADLPPNTLTFALGAGAPAGATIDATTGLFSWTPSPAAGPSTNTIGVIVTDNGVPRLSANQTFRVVVQSLNRAPVISPIGNQTVAEETPFTLAVLATDPDLPAQTLTYSITGAPNGMSINSASGLIAWTPTEDQGPSTNRITIRVADNGVPPQSASQEVTVVVTEVNRPPRLAGVPNQTLIVGNALSVQLQATDVDLPPNILSYNLGAGAPAGATVNAATGLISWTPTAAQGLSTNNFSVTVTDNGTPNLSTNLTFRVVVALSNAAPTLGAIPNQTVDEGSLLSLTITGADADLPPQPLRYGLLDPVPPGAQIDAASGLFTWTPTEAQGPSTNQIRVRVTDSVTPPLSATNGFSVVVREVNLPPSIAPIPDQTVNEVELLTVAVRASDPDLPPNVLQFALGVNAPAGAAINPATGVFTWTPTRAQGPSTNVIAITVSDGGTPNLSTNATFRVVVNEINSPPVLAAIANQRVDEGTPLTFTAVGTDPDLPPQTLQYSLGVGAPSGASINAATGVFTWTPTEVQGPSTNVVSVRVTDSGTPIGRASQEVTIVVNEVNAAPVINTIPDLVVGLGGTLTVTASARDSDLPANILRFSLQGAPTGASINATNGVMTWAPAPNQAASTNRITIVVTDNGPGTLSANTSFTAVVGINVAPTLSSITAQTVAENGTTTAVAFTLTDPDTPLVNFKFVAVSSDPALVPNENIIIGGTGANRTVQVKPAADKSGTATITLTATEPAGGNAVTAFDLTVAPLPPGITRQPADREALAGGEATFSVTATGSRPIAYQWSKGGTLLPGATNAVLVISNVQTNNAGLYSVAVSNRQGSITSREAALAVVVPLRITQQPVSQKVLAGGNVTLSVVAEGAGPLTYEWSVNGVAIPGATTATLQLNAVEAILSGGYTVVVKSAAASVTSAPAQLDVVAPVVITTQPADLSVPVGTNVTFRVEATGSAPIRYQWRHNGVDLPGQTNSVLTLSNLAASNSGGYSVAASNAGGTVTGAGGNLVVSAPPTISRHPQSKAVLAGAPVSFEVTVSGTPPLAYQWRFDGTNIPGATGPALNLPSVASTASGGYSVIVSNPGGTVTSEVATLTVTQGVVITAQPSDQTVAAGGSASFSVAATGSQPLTYQWRFKGVDIPAATNQTLTVSAVLAANAGGYQVVVANAAGPVPSAVANLTVNVGVTIVEQPQSLTVTNGSSVAFSVLAAGSGPLTYQWRFNGANIPGATQANVAVPNVQPANAGAYSVVVQNVVGSVPSANANLSVIIPPTIQTQPSSQSVNLDASVTLSVVATGDAPMSYQWQKNGGSIPGATGSSLTIGAVNPSDSGSYTVVVQNPGGAVTSQAASLSVILPSLPSGNSATTAGNPIQSAQGSFDLGSNAANGAQIARRNAPPAAGSERWFSWRAPSSGIVTFNTAGSTFDTLLVVYTGTPPNLTEIARDDDRGGFLASEVQFNAVQGTTYLVNVQGFGGAAGQIVVSFNLNATAQQLPVLTIVPQSRTAAVGSAVTFTVSAGGTNLSYQWLRNGAEIAGQTTTSLNLSNIQEADASNYSVRVTSSGTGTPVSVETLPALLQISTANTLSEDKFLNAPRLSGGVQLQSLGGSLVIPPPSKQAGGSVARGFSGSQVFNTFGASKEQGEPNHCDEVGGASQWFTYVAPETGVVRVSTEGSNFDTVLAIYTGPGTSFASLVLVGCDNNSGSDGKTSAVNLRVTKDTQYFVAVDGVGGATGSVKLNYEFAQGPSIAAQPQSVSVKQGDQVVFTVQLAAPVAGAATVPSTYQWTKNGFPIAGETANNLAYASVALANAGDYAVVVSNFAGSTTSDTVRLDVSVPLAISVQPVDRLSGVGETVSFAVVASGSDPITYQWQLNGVNVAAATAASYEIQNVQTTHGGVYSVVITNPVGFVTSATATLTINEAPTVTVRPVDVAAVLGDQATFSVEAIGTGTLSYQWRLNGVNIAGANQASLVLNAVGSENVGDYTVVVSNATGAVVSPSARLSVQVPLSLVEGPQSQQLGIGSTAIFNVRASGSGTLSYQWRLNSTNIPGATEPTLALTDVQPASSGIYSVLVTSGAESIESAGAILSVSALPLISTQPQSMVAYAGSDVTFSVAATGSGPLQYQWFVNGQPIDTATASNLTLTGVGLVDAGSYSVSVRNSAGAVSSDLAILTVREIISNLAQNAFTGVDQTVTEFRFRVSVPEGRQARIQVSTDFVDWTDLTPTPVTGILDVEDPDAPSLELRFYRVLDAGAAQ